MKISPRYLNLKGQTFQVGNHILDLSQGSEDWPEFKIGVQILYESPGWKIVNSDGEIIIEGKYFDEHGHAVAIDKGVTDSDMLREKYNALNLDPSLALIDPPSTWAVIFN